MPIVRERADIKKEIEGGEVLSNIIISKSSNLNDSLFGKSYHPIKFMMTKRAEAFEQQSAIPQLFVEMDSDKFAEKLTSVTSMNNFEPVDEGGAFPTNGFREGYAKALEHVSWKSDFTITREMVEDSVTLDLRQKPMHFVAAYYRIREMFAAALLGGATQPTVNVFGRAFSATAADGRPLFSGDHPSLSGGEGQSNCFSDAFSIDSLALAEARMQNFKDENGYPLNVVPDTIIIPNQGKLKQQVFAAIGADKDPNSANNGFNYLFGMWRVVVWPYWVPKAGESPWILCSSNYNQDSMGAVWLNRKKLTVRADEDPNTWNMRWAGMARFIAGFNDWRAFTLMGCPGGDALE